MNDDTISRQAAIDAIDKVAEMFPYRIPGQAKTYRQYNEAWSDACDASEMAIDGLPSAQPEYERVSAEDVAVSIAPTKLASAVWFYGTLTELEKAGYVICRKMI